MSLIKDYTIVAGNSIPELVANVNEKVKEYWQPIGGATISTVQVLGDKHATIALQAMVKY